MVKPSKSSSQSPKNKSIGPLFDIVATNDPEGLRRYPVSIYALRLEPTGWAVVLWSRQDRCEVTREIGDIANELVLRFNECLGIQHHWEKHKRFVASDDGLRGTPARKEAIRRIMEGPDGPGKRFLLSLTNKKFLSDAVAQSLSMPKTDPPKCASREELERLTTKARPATTGPIAFDPEDPQLRE